MSSDFDMSDGSDFEAPVAKPKAAKKAAPVTAAVKKAAASKPKAAAPKAKIPKKRSKESDDEDEPDDFDDESLLADTPPAAKKAKTSAPKGPKNPAKSPHSKPLGELVNEAMAQDPSVPKKKKRVSEQYQKLTQLEHIIKRPDTYIGSVERNERHMWVFNQQENRMEYREISFVPGVFKIFDEILVNAADNKQNDKNQSYIDVHIDRERGVCSVENDGRGIPIEIHSKEKIYIPEMIFGVLLTGSNYDDDEQKITGGRNGYGAKLCNIFSTKFTIETASSKHKKKYKQVWTDNMSKMHDPIIAEQKGEDYTKVTVYDLAGTLKGVKIRLNGKGLPALPSQSFERYAELYTKAIKLERGDDTTTDDSNIIMAKEKNERWSVGVAVSDGSFQQVSFTNSINTSSGGTHVNMIVDQLVTKLAAHVKKGNKGGVALKPAQIKNHLFLFVNAQIVNPAYTSQTKEQLTNKASSFGSKFEVTDAFVKKIVEGTSILQDLLATQQQKADSLLKKTDGKKRTRMNNPKLVDANKAGTASGHLCTLILTEGDSAKGLAMAGRAVVSPDHFGVFPLRGKILNVRDATVDQISKNAEINAIKSFLGLQHKKVYEDTRSLRYGHLMIMTDQDHDGSHIKGLLINFLQCQFPSLLRIPEFLVEFITPIVKIWKGDAKHPTQQKTFFTMPEYEAWKAEGHKGWSSKYYKGLGTSTAEDAQVYFSDLERHHKEFHTMREGEPELIELAFSNKKADERKTWLQSYKAGDYLDHSAARITYTDFVNKELMLFSLADCVRSIPSVVDGLKPGMRKCLYTALKKNLRKDMKVVEFAGIVLGMTAYHHGETSLQSTIVGLAQNFVGSNNINLLEPSGNFGSRLQGGADSASARYIYTRLSPFARKLFHVSDEPLLTYNTDDDQTIEPEIYAPILPMLLVNGADGIGTGWSTSIPNFNPVEIVDNLKRKMNGEDFLPMQPWFRGFKGEVTETGPGKFQFSGLASQLNDTEIEISELPVRMWTQTFKDKLEEILKAEKAPSFIKDYKDYNTHKDVLFTIQMESEKHMEAALKQGLVDKFKLTKQVSLANLVAFDPEGRIRKYDRVEDILDEFYRYRLQLYAKRKTYMLETMHKELTRLTNMARFVQMIVDGELIVAKKRKAKLVVELQELKFKAFAKEKDAAKAGEKADAVEEDEEQDAEINAQASAYDYLLGMPIWSLTQERIEKLRKQMGDKEHEIDALSKTSIQDLWRTDLDEFVTEWETQLEDERQTEKKIRKGGRRASAKFHIGGKTASKKRKNKDDDSDDDFDDRKKAKKPALPKAVPAPKAVQGSLDTFMKKKNPVVKRTEYAPPAKSKVHSTIAQARSQFTDGSSDSEPTSRAETPAEGVGSSQVSKPKVKTEAPIGTIPKPDKPRGRAAANKAPIKYTVDSDDDSDGDDLLADLGTLVKPLGGNTTESKPLFNTSTSRPSSSHDFKLPTKPPAPKISDSISDDEETDYKALAPQSSPRRSILVTNKDTTVFEDDASEQDDDSEEDFKPATTKSKARGRPKKGVDSDVESVKPKATAAAKKKTAAPSVKAPVKKVAASAVTANKKAAAAATAKKEPPQSPAAKAYAKRLAKKKTVILSDDEDDDLVNDLLDSPAGKDNDAMDVDDSDDEDVKPAARAGRRAATNKKPVKYAFDDSDDEVENDDSFAVDVDDSD
ncbi:DNA topoisomerase 2 [Cyphellophora attinorum]|uniref:DNA topoisomerase 2 n=1 Tax=Cyphellophora attinorum TaxID=1664694 RepID=A0A0N1H9P5_9EURO|nr:DNA topoisomerase 2 [Phialophora attinorum]KPI40324.1 DNA topoisomerase 2 [Phialophora attinorum]